MLVPSSMHFPKLSTTTPHTLFFCLAPHHPKCICLCSRSPLKCLLWSCPPGILPFVISCCRMCARVSDLLLLNRIWQSNGLSLQILGYQKSNGLKSWVPALWSSHLFSLINQDAMVWASLWKSHEAGNWEQLQPEASEHLKPSVQNLSTWDWKEILPQAS